MFDGIEKRGEKGKKAQVAIFVIIALVIVAGIVIFFVFKDSLMNGNVPGEFSPVFKAYEECIEEETKAGLDLAGTQGGRINPGEYIPGGEYAPSGNQLNFLGFPVPYWFYVSGNGIIKENVPTKSEIENELSVYIGDRIENCNFEEFYGQGFDILLEKPEVRMAISEKKVSVKVISPLTVSKENESAMKSQYDLSINSQFGGFYLWATEVYKKEMGEAFLEEYAIDVLRLYAPVDGLEISCSPRVWQTNQVADDIKIGLEENINTIKFSGDYYKLTNSTRKYFVVDKQSEDFVNVVYSKGWPTKIEIIGAENGLMLAEPIGNQPGLGVMGFCYSPYHFVYDVYFPVLIQIYNGEELFQFPVIVIIDNNIPREVDLSSGFTIQENKVVDICNVKTKDIDVRLSDIYLNPVNGNVSYQCLDQICRLGETEFGRLITKAPACLNGYVMVDVNGYMRKKKVFSTTEEVAADLILDKAYEVEIEVTLNGNSINNNRAIVSFIPNTENAEVVTAVLPEASKVKLSEGLYNLSVYVYGESGITIPGGTTSQCYEVPRGAIGGLFGLTKKECVDIQIPDTKIDEALIGGGKAQEYLLPTDLDNDKITIVVSELPAPNSLEQLQVNFEIFDNLEAYIEYK